MDRFIDMNASPDMDIYPNPDKTSLSAFEQVMSGEATDLVQEFWELDTFITGCGPPDEQAAVEQLLALQLPSETLDLSSQRFPPPSTSDNKPSSGKLYGVEGLALTPESSAGAVSSGIFHGKGKGNSHFFGSFDPALQAHS